MTRYGWIAILVASCVIPNNSHEVSRQFKLLSFLDGSDQAIILGATGIPTPTDYYAQTVADLYLNPLGFTGSGICNLPGDCDLGILTTPEQSDWNQSVDTGVQDLVSQVESDYNAGDISADDPLTIFGYSQGAVVEGDAEQQLADYGVPLDDLRFVMLGDPNSPEGMLAWLNADLAAIFGQPTATWLEKLFDVDQILGVTPDNLYPTDVYTLQGDGFADFQPDYSGPGGLLDVGWGIETDHQEYLGLTADQISNIISTQVDGSTTYYEIGNAGVDGWTALMDSLQHIFDFAA